MDVLFKSKRTPLSEVITRNETLNEFTVVDSQMNEIKSQNLSGIKLYLTLPSVDTRVCSLELSRFIEYLKDEDIIVLSISMDLPFALSRWCQNHTSDRLIVTSDFRYHDFADASGCFMPQIGLFARSVILVDEKNLVRYIEIVDDVSNEVNYQEVMNQIKMLKK